MSNPDKLKVRQTESKKNALKELTIIRDTIFWIDVVGEGQNENAIFARPFNEKDAFPQKLTSKKFNIKNNFHGYGGKSYKCINFKNNFYLIWIDQITKAVWFQIFKEAATTDRSQNKYLVSVQEPNQLSKSIDGNFDSSFVISEKNVIPVTHCGTPYSIKFLSTLFLIKIFSISLTSKNNKFHHPELSSEHTKCVSLIQYG